MTNRCVLALAVCALACSKPPEPVRPEPRARTTRQYQPLAMTADARHPGQAVILGTDGADGSTLLPLPGTPGTVVVDALFVAPGAAGASAGGSIAVTLSAGPNAPLQPDLPDAQAAPGTSGSAAAARAPSAPAAARAPSAPAAMAAPLAPARTSAAPNGSPAAPLAPIRTSAAPNGSPAAPLAPARTSAAPSGSPAAPNGSPAAPLAPARTSAAPNGSAAAPSGSPAAPSGPPAAPNGSPAAPNGLAAPTAAAVVVGPLDAGGAPWQAGLWSAALVAASTLGKDVTALTFSAAPPVPGEHPAASALLAGAFLATLTGAKIDPGAALVGAIQLDGTIGPVAGIPELFMAAIARGKTRLGYPSGMRVARSLAGKEVDLARLAKAHRVEAVEIAGIHDAYQLLTRAPLPAPVPVSEEEMALDAATLDRLDARYLAWRKRLADEWAPLLQLEQSGRLPPAVKVRVRLAHERSEQAEALYRAGKLPAAYARMAAAWVSAAAANAAYAVLAKLASGDIDGAAAALSAAGPTEATTGALLAQVGALRPSTLAGHLAMVAAFQAALRGWSYDAFAADAIRATTQLLGGYRGKPASELGAPATLDAIARAVVPAALMRFRTIAENDLADQELEPEQGIAHACSAPDVMRLAGVFQRAAAAGLRHVDGLLVEPLAQRAAITAAAARERIASAEPGYVIADMLSRVEADGLPHDFAASWGEHSVSASLLELAGHGLAYHQAAVLIAKYDALAVHVDSAGRVDAVAHPAALRGLLASAARTARASARAARVATGAIPLQAKLAYQLATVEATGGVADQLDALAELWTASMFSQLAVMLARN